ncbi:hypothetical protein [Enterococcus faecalis]|uniref:hypothetical protein n=1 Tax=Enterococcus faecalis TaxID=1351 RepID=UPI001E37CB42|nr:hypothetical protein [Enterococcus faecalis]
MTYTEKIEKLMGMDLTSYRIAKETGISTQYIDKIRSGKTAIENIGLGKAEALVKYLDEVSNDSSKYIKFDTSNLTELKRFDGLPELEAVSRVKKYALDYEVALFPIVKKKSDIFENFLEYNYTLILYEDIKRPNTKNKPTSRK